MALHLHFDPVGGVAGDMAIAALLDAFPQHLSGMMEAIRLAGLPASWQTSLVSHRDHALTGRRFLVEEAHEHGHEHDHHHHHHGHTPFGEIRRRLVGSKLAPAVARRAVAIFALLADAEAKVHGYEDLDQVSFHELGEWDSIADIVGAAWLIETIGAASWSTAPLPLGSGRVQSAHGLLPVPAPATALLLRGFESFADDLKGERVTPTGAAILKHLACANGLGARPRRLVGTGIGFGTKVFPGISNVLRVLAFEEAEVAADTTTDWAWEDIAVVAFEVDDQAPEDLVMGLERLRATAGVRDAIQAPVMGKKGRLAIRVQVIAEPAHRDAVIAACFRETTTIGLRVTAERRAALIRRHDTTDTGIAVKRARRPGGAVTAKAEIDSARDAESAAGRERLRHAAEQEALKKPWKDE